MTAISGLVLLGVLHLPATRARALSWVITQLESRYGLLLASDALSFNLLTGSATLTNLRLAAQDTPEQPFLTAARVHADVPLAAALAGRLVLDDVVIDGGRLTIVTDESGRSNLPGGDGAPPPAEPRALALRGLHLNDFAFLYDNRSTGMRISATGVEAALDDRDRSFAGAKGPFAINGGIDVEWDDREMRVEPFEARIGFDGRDVSVQDLAIVTDLGGLSISGDLHRVLDALSLELGFDGQIDVARAAAWAAPLPVPVSGTSAVRGTIVGPTDALEIAARFDAPSLTVGTEQGLMVSGEVLIDPNQLTINRLTASPESGGELSAALQVPFGDGPLTSTIAWQGVDARVLMRAANVEPQPIATRLDGTATFTGDPGRVLTLETNLTALPESGAMPLSGRIGGGLRGTSWQLTHDLRADGVRITGSVQGQVNDADPGNSTLAGPTRVAIDSLSAVDRSLAPFGIRVPEALRDAEGAIEAEATLRGTVRDPHVALVANAPAFDVPGVGPAAIAATVEADSRGVAIAPLTMTGDGSDATGEIRIDLERRTIDGTIRAEVADVAVLQTELPEERRIGGALEADAVLSGTLDAPVVDLHLAAPTLTFAGDTFEGFDSRLRVIDDGVDIVSMTVSQDQGGRLSLTGRYEFDRTFTATLEAAAMTWSGVLAGDAESRVTVNGKFTGSGSLDRPVGRGDFTFDVAGGLAGDLVGTGTIAIDLLGPLARVNAHLPSLGAFANATIATSSPFDYRAVLVIDGMDLAELTPLVGAVPGQLTGYLDATAAASGAFAGDGPVQVEANLQRMQAQVGGVPVNLIAPATVSWRPDNLTVRNFTATLGDGTLSVEGERSDRTGSVFSASYRGEIAELVSVASAFGVESTAMAPRGWIDAEVYATDNPQDLIVSVALTGGYLEIGQVVLTSFNTVAGLKGEALTLHALSGRVDTAKAGGTFTGSGAATIPGLDPMQATGRFVLDSATFDSAGVEVKQTRPTTIAVDRGVVTMEDFVWEAVGSELGLSGSIDLTGDAPLLDLNVRGTAVLRVLTAFLPALGVDGTAEVDIRVAGTAAEPDLSGTIQLNDAEIALSSPRLVISELSGPITFGGNRVTFGGLQGSANGGQLTIDGGVEIAGFELVGGQVHAQAVGMAIEYPRGLRSEIDALLTYDLSGATPLLGGDVRVLRSSFTEPISLAALARQNNAPTVRPLAGDSALDDLRLNVSVTTVEDIRVDNNYGRFDAGAQLRIVGTAAQPGMSGRVTLREGGRVFVAGRTFTVSRGNISFSDLSQIRPDLDIQAVTRVTNLGEVTMTLTGTPDQLEFDLASEQNASQEEIATALLGGGVSGVNAIALLSSDLLGVTGRQIGLDALRIDRGDVIDDEFREDPSALLQDERNLVTRLTLSKRLRDNVEFTVSQNLAGSGKTTFIVSYFPLDNLELRAISRDDGTQGFGVRHQMTLGGTPAQRTAAPREEVLVNEVRLEGTLAPFTEDELRRTLRVRPGRPFEFHEWQADLDGLTARYVERGFVEARVRGARDPIGEAAVIVVYTITPGPETRIQVDGIDVTDADLQALRQIWAQGVFDRFIIEDAETHLRRLLLTRGHVKGAVYGRIETSDGVKTLYLTVEPGPPARNREMRFTGNTALSRNELDSVVQQSGLETVGWIDHDLLTRTLIAHYRAEGFLAADVRVDEPYMDGDLGVLPVTITEGPRAMIRDVQWSGVAEAHDAGARREAGLEAGAPFTQGGVDTARTRLDRYYRALGHNAVEVRITVTPVDEGGEQVDVAIAIVEGPQQILAEVDTVGATRTREGVVSRALRLPVGRPVNLQEWALARKRLFDTNVFRSVDIQAVPLGDPVDGVQQVRAVVTVEEYPPWRLRYGLQVDRNREDTSVEGLEDAPPELTLGGIAEIRNQNLFGRAITGGVATRIEIDFQRVNTFVQSASFFGLPLRSALFVYGSREKVDADSTYLFTEEDRGVSFEQRWRRRRGFEITYGYRFERTLVYNHERPDPIDAVNNDGRLTAALLFDRRRNPLEPSGGTFSSVAFERAAGWLASDTSYTRVLVQQTGFLQRGSMVLAGRVMSGGITGDDIPIGDTRFLTGGATTVRGYGENSLGPRDIFNIPNGGTTLLVLNQELRFPVYRWFRGVGFFDVGNTFDATYPFAWSEMKLGYGIGLRFDSPVGLLRLDFAIPGSTIPSSGRQPNRFSSGRWYFGFGHIF